MHLGALKAETEREEEGLGEDAWRHHIVFGLNAGTTCVVVVRPLDERQEKQARAPSRSTGDGLHRRPLQPQFTAPPHPPPRPTTPSARPAVLRRAERNHNNPRYESEVGRVEGNDEMKNDFCACGHCSPHIG